MQTISSQDQLNRIENRLERVTELLELLLGKIAQKESKEIDEIPNARLRKSLQQSEEDIKAGRVLSFASAKDALVYLDKEIADEKHATH
jgi:hypothetical protein